MCTFDHRSSFPKCQYKSSTGSNDSIGTIAEDGTKWLNNLVVDGESSKQFWSSVVTAICASINNPQNGICFSCLTCVFHASTMLFYNLNFLWALFHY